MTNTDTQGITRKELLARRIAEAAEALEAERSEVTMARYAAALNAFQRYIEKHG